MISHPGASISPGLATAVEMPYSGPTGTSSVDIVVDGKSPRESAAQVLIEHLFANADTKIPQVSYAVSYRLAEEFIGGDIVDVYHFDNNCVAFAIADISGKGAQAAVHAALIKYGLRAYSSHGLTPEAVLRALARLYLENNEFENVESFASVFFAVADPTRRTLTFANGGHEPILVVSPAGVVSVLKPTAPLIGVFDDQHHLFRQEAIPIENGTLLVATTDGVTEARTRDGEFFGMERFIAAVEASRELSPEAIVERVIDDVQAFSQRALRDDIAIVVVRFG
jgi:sigma-B regulation protein RsbU (phosphoserine phosphatase)